MSAFAAALCGCLMIWGFQLLSSVFSYSSNLSLNITQIVKDQVFAFPRSVPSWGQIINFAH